MKTKLRARLDTHLVLDVRDIPSKLLFEIKEEYTKSNPEFFKRKAMGFWIGGTPRKIESFVQEGTKLILPRGALGKVNILAQKHDCELEVKDKRLYLEKATFRPTDRSILRPYQEEAITALEEANWNGTIRGPCGSGKTITLIAAIARLGQPTLVVVHSKALAQQWRAAILAWLGISAGTIEGKKTTIKPITVATQQSLWKAIESNRCPWIGNFGALVGDEIHHWAARTFQIVVSAFPAAYRFGASADERRKDGMEHLIYETFGELVSKIEKDRLIKIGKLLPTHLEIVATNYCNQIYCDSIKVGEVPDWVNMISKLVDDEDRNELIVREVLKIISEKENDAMGRAIHMDRTRGNVNGSRGSVNDPDRCRAIHMDHARSIEAPISGLEKGFSSCVVEGASPSESPEEIRLRTGGSNFLRSPPSPKESVLNNNGDLRPYKAKIIDHGSRDIVDRCRAIHMDHARSTGCGNSVLILNDRVEACRRLAARLECLGFEVGLLLGGPGNRRELEESIVGLRSGSLRVGIGTTVADEGLDIPRLTHVLLTCPVHKHPKRMEQMIGRAARPFGEKKQATCIYLWDALMFPGMKRGERLEEYEKRQKAFVERLAKVANTFSVR